MNLLGCESALNEFFGLFEGPREPVLMLDYDGTLAEFQVEREKVRPYPRVLARLKEIRNAGTRLVIVSGRRAEWIRDTLDLGAPIEIWGAHGTERIRNDGGFETFEIPGEAMAGALEAFQAGENAGLGPQMERKPGAVALHWRGHPAHQVTALKRWAGVHWWPIASRHGMRFLQFDGGIEVRPEHPNKGDVVQQVIRETEGPAAFAYLGDDYTDEDAFQALKGAGLSALVRKEYRGTAADLWLNPPEELEAFLRRWQEVAKGVLCRA